MENRESQVKDLAEKLERGELTPKEILKILDEQTLRYRENWQGFIGTIA
jgi:hypothetical protein